MRGGGHASAAIEIVNEILSRARPAAEALKDWGKAHRFAGSGDRAAIGNLVYDVLRRKQSLAHAMASEAPRALVLAALRFVWKLSPSAIEEFTTAEHGPGVLSEHERAALSASGLTSDAPEWVVGDFPVWLDKEMSRAFGAERAAQGRALSERAPLDLRVNTLKTTTEKAAKALAKFGAVAGPLTKTCLRIVPPQAGGRSPNVEAEPAHAKGWFEVQDQGSQAAALLCGAMAGQQVADICAGAGGKTLALAAAMDNRGQIHAYDDDRHRLRPIFERIARAGARNVQITPADEPHRLETLLNRMDIVLVDAPCSGSGTWRRKPDAKWRLRPEALKIRQTEQAAVLDKGATLVRPGGRLVYITCSVFTEENRDQVDAFLKRHPGFRIEPWEATWRSAIGTATPTTSDGTGETLLLTPLDHGTDGFYVAILMRAT